VHIGDNKVIIDKGNVIDYVFGLAQDCTPIIACGIIDVDSYEASA